MPLESKFLTFVATKLMIPFFSLETILVGEATQEQFASEWLAAEEVGKKRSIFCQPRGLSNVKGYLLHSSLFVASYHSGSIRSSYGHSHGRRAN